ncbi:hypothetical protein N7488_004806 [Penicillium malachiteum]|nr:hypothetical protein N7488_004806 [Penicillium malachiteum]
MEYQTQSVTLCYLANLPKYQTEKPFSLAYTNSHLEKQVNNLEYEEHKGIQIRDIRGFESNFNVDTDAFTIVKEPMTLNIDAGKEEELSYIRDMASVITKVFSADRVITYDIRRRHNVPVEELRPLSSGEYPAAPVPVVHVDHTPLGGLHRIRRHITPEEEEKYLGNESGWRIRIVKYGSGGFYSG